MLTIAQIIRGISKTVVDPYNTDRKIILEKLRGGRPTKIILPKKGPGSYKRKTDWRTFDLS